MYVVKRVTSAFKSLFIICNFLHIFSCLSIYKAVEPGLDLHEDL